MSAPDPASTAETAARLAAIVDGSADAIIGKTIQGVVTSWNPAAEAIFGYCAAEAIGQPLLILFPPDRQHEEADILARIAAGERVPPFETIRVRKDGRRIDVSVSISPIRNADGVVVGASTIARDISAQKVHEREIESLTRLYAALSQINQAIVWTADRDALLQKICEVLVDFGGFRLAWIGWRSTDGPTLVPVAISGAARAHFRDMQMPVGPSRASSSPTIIAFTEGRHYVCNDMLADSALLAWRDQLERINFRACAAFPLRLQGEVAGTLSVYSDQIGFFQEREIALLAEAAIDTSFAVENLAREEARQTSESRYRALFDYAPDGILIADPNSVYLDANPAMCRLLGYTRNELIGRHASDIVEADPKHIEAALETLNAGGEHEQEWRFRRKDGSMFAGFTRVTPMPDGNLLALIRDVTDRKEAEAQLAEQAALLEQSQDGILVRDLTGRILYWNSGAARLYGWSSAEAIGKNARDLLYRDPSSFESAMAALLKDGQWSGELSQMTRQGDDRTVEARWTLLCDDAGKPKSVLSVNTDVTERRRLEMQFLRAQRMESVGTLAGGIAHDLNNVLAPMLMSIELLRPMARNDMERTLLDTLETNTQRGAALVRQVLSFARGVKVERVAVEPLALVSDLLKVVRETFPRDIDVRIDCARDVGKVFGDPTQLHQVFMNLFVNARDAMPNGGTMTVIVENMIVDEAFAAFQMDAAIGSYIRIAVVDTGVGIAPNDRSRVFEPFFTTKEIGKGTGLGLSTTQTIVRSHRGFMTLDSSLGRGTRFDVYLPSTDMEGALTEITETKASTLTGRGELVLVVDDEEAIRVVAKRMLEVAGHRVVLAANGADAVSIYARRKHEIAVVVSDMAMPVMDGSAMVMALTALNPDVRIVASSGLDVEGAMTPAARAAVRAFLPKPYSADDLVSAIRRAIQG